jgi:hypothetical protein
VKQTGRHRLTLPNAAWGSVLVIGSLLLAPCGHAEDRAVCSFSVGQPLRSRGDSFTLSVTNGPAEAMAAVLTFGRVRDGEKVAIGGAKYVPVNGGDTGRVTGTIGPAVALGGYLVDLVLKDTICSAADPKPLLTVAPPGNVEPHLDKFDPPYSYVSRTMHLKKAESDSSDGVKTRVTDLVLRGHGFQSVLTDNVILINSVPQNLVPGNCAAADSVDPSIAGQITAQLVSDQEIDLCSVPVPENGQFRVEVRVGDLPASEQQAFVVFRYGKTSVGLASGIIALALALLPLYLLSWIKGSYTIGDQAYKLRLLFLDPQTDSYSLSKLQFYLWTVAALFSYAYLFISRVMVQQAAIWPDIPPNLPGVIAVAAGTSIGSQFITSSKGSKGAGPIQPGFADFITSGGVVAPDRVQMLLWTLLGVAAFLVTTLGDAPGTIKSLPSVPENLLYLMGLSSAGYLGGKLARKAGPVINEISVSPTDPDDAIISAAASSSADGPDLTEAIAAAQQGLAGGAAAANVHAQAALKALADAVGAARAAQNTEEFGTLLDTLAELRQRAETESQGAAQDFAGQPAKAQAAADALQLFFAGVTQAVAQSASFHMREALEIPRIIRTITLRGSNLSAEAMLQMDHVDLPFRMLTNSEDKQAPEIVSREDSPPTFARVLQLSIDPANLEESDFQQFRAWFGTKGTHTFALTNPDGQMAEASFQVPPGEGQKSGTAP